MLVKVFLFLIGFGLTTIGFVYIICYLNLFSIGYNFLEYVNFIIRRFECLCSIIGITLMSLSMIMGGKNEKYELYL